MRPDMSYTTYATSPNEQTGNIITFTQFEERGALFETREDVESSEEYDEN